MPTHSTQFLKGTVHSTVQVVIWLRSMFPYAFHYFARSQQRAHKRLAGVHARDEERPSRRHPAVWICEGDTQRTGRGLRQEPTDALLVGWHHRGQARGWTAQVHRNSFQSRKLLCDDQLACGGRTFRWVREVTLSIGGVGALLQRGKWSEHFRLIGDGDGQGFSKPWPSPSKFFVSRAGVMLSFQISNEWHSQHF